MDKDPTQLADFIRQRRAELGLSMRETARRAKIHVSTISELESGRIANLTLPTLQRLASALDVDYEDLVGLAGYVMPSGLPTLPVYLRTKHHHLTPEQITHLENEVRFMEWQREQAEKRQQKGGGHADATDNAA